MDFLKPPAFLRDLLPQAGKDFLDVGGWYLVLAVVALLVVAVLAILLRRMMAGGGKKERRDEDSPLRENLGEYPPAPNRPGNRQVLVESIPGRLRLVVLAPMGHGQTVSADNVEAYLEQVLRGLGTIAKQDKPRVRVWPPQLSIDGFGNTFHRVVKKPERETDPSRWMLLAGQARTGKQFLLLGLAFQADEENTVGRMTLQPERWGQVLRVKSGES